MDIWIAGADLDSEARFAAEYAQHGRWGGQPVNAKCGMGSPEVMDGLPRARHRTSVAHVPGVRAVAACQVAHGDFVTGPVSATELPCGGVREFPGVPVYCGTMGFVLGVRDEPVACQKLNALDVNAGALCAVFGFRREKDRSPECGMIGPPRSKMRMNVVRNRVDGRDGQIDEQAGHGFIESEQDAGGARIGTDGAPDCGERCTRQRQRGAAGECGL